jgi:hypothetical protein
VQRKEARLDASYAHLAFLFGSTRMWIRQTAHTVLTTAAGPIHPHNPYTVPHSLEEGKVGQASASGSLLTFPCQLVTIFSPSASLCWVSATCRRCAASLVVSAFSAAFCSSA